MPPIPKKKVTRLCKCGAEYVVEIHGQAYCRGCVNYGTRDDKNAKIVGGRRQWKCPVCRTVHWSFKQDICLNELCPAKKVN